MNIGEKISLLKENMGFKNYQEFGKFVDLSGDWCLELSKKKEITTVDITRLIRISSKFNVSLDWLVLENGDNADLNILQNLSEDDIGLLLTNIQNSINNNSIFNGTTMNELSVKLAVDSIKVIKKLIQQNL